MAVNPLLQTAKSKKGLAPFCYSGEGGIWTHDQGLMSPLLYR